MKQVVLHGLLKKLTCPMFKANVHSFKELLSCIVGNFDKFNSRINMFLKNSNAMLIVADGKIITNIKYLDSIFNRIKRIELIPLCTFSAAATATIAFTSIKVSAWAAFAINTIIFVALSIGISLLLSKLLSPKQPNQIKTSSYIFSSKENLAQRNTPVPVSYGRLRLSSQIISSFNLNFDLASNFDVFTEQNQGSVATNFLSAKI
jgi:predicted phage tail protein